MYTYIPSTIVPYWFVPGMNLCIELTVYTWVTTNASHAIHVLGVFQQCAYTTFVYPQKPLDKTGTVP